MPCNYKEDYAPDWKATSRRIRFERAGGKCERCGAPHKAIIIRSDDGRYMLPETGETFDAETGQYLGLCKGSEFPDNRFVKVILTVAHLDHDTNNNEESNLMAFCQLHHFNHDRKNNGVRRKYGKVFIAKSKQIPFGQDVNA